MAEDVKPQRFEIDTREKLDAWTGDIAKWNAWGAEHLSEDFEPLDPDLPVHPVLKGEAAMALWKAGGGEWNDWVKCTPQADIDFSQAKFEPRRKDYPDTPKISFETYKFPQGDISFHSATFGEGNVSFMDAVFADGYVIFAHAKFSDGNVRFDRAKFGDGRVRFDYAKFGDGGVHFNEANFGKGSVSFFATRFGNGYVRFNDANFGDGHVSFSRTNFGDGDLSFDYANFGKGELSFQRASFGDGGVSFFLANLSDGGVRFDNATFGEGYVRFNGAEFGEGDVRFFATTFGKGVIHFDNATLGKGNVDFRHSSFGAGHVSFGNCTFDGTARFTNLDEVDECALFSFEGCSFEKLFTFSHKGKMGGPIDLRRTKLAHTLVVADIHCDYARGPQSDWSAWLSNWLCAVPRWPHPPDENATKGYRIGPPPAWKWQKIAADREDSQRFRRLKELAVANRNHAKALEFHAREIQTARGHGTSALQDLGQFLYWATSDYGRSVKRPLGWLVAVCILWAGLLWNLRQPVASFPNEVRQRLGEATPDFWTALIYSASNMLSFIPTGRTARTQGEVLLFGGFVPEYIIALNGVQTVLSVILLFLLSLGLRNMFRV